MQLRRFRNNAVRGWVDPSVELPPGLLEGPDKWDLRGKGEVLVSTEGRSIFRLDLARSSTPHSCFVHVFRNRSLGRALRRNCAFHILDVSRRMRESGFRTLEVLAALRPRAEFLNWNSLLVASEISPVYELPSSGNHVFPIHKTIDFDSKVSSSVAQELARFHSSNFAHGDLKTRHVLARVESLPLNGVRPEIVLVDLEKAHHLPALPPPIHDVFAARDLIQLFASLPGSLNGNGQKSIKREFLDEYLECRKVSKKRASRIEEILKMYQPGGRLVQGKTLLSGLADLAFRRTPRQ